MVMKFFGTSIVHNSSEMYRPVARFAVSKRAYCHVYSRGRKRRQKRPRITRVYCTEKTIYPFPFTLNAIWSWWLFSFQFWTKWNSIWFKIERETAFMPFSGIFKHRKRASERAHFSPVFIVSIFYTEKSSGSLVELNRNRVVFTILPSVCKYNLILVDLTGFRSRFFCVCR